MEADQPFESIEEALKEVIRVCGWTAEVGSALWPALPVTQAQTKLADCLNPDRRDKLSLDELLLLLAMGRQKACHVAMSFLATRAGYEPPRPVTPAEELTNLQMEFIRALGEMKAMGERIEAATVRNNNLTVVRGR